MSIKQDQVQKLLDLLRSIDESLKTIASVVDEPFHESGCETKVLNVDIVSVLDQIGIKDE